MDKVYNLSKLFEEVEFDAHQSYNRHAKKEAYFSVLSKFTLETENILKVCTLEHYNNKDIDIHKYKEHIDSLQILLGSIGAVNLAWSIQSMNHYYENQYYWEYVRKTSGILPDVGKLRERIISAEKQSVTTVPSVQAPPAAASRQAPESAKRRAKPRRSDFKKLMMLIDNFEFDSAIEAVAEITQNTYTPEIDSTLAEVLVGLNQFNYDKSVKEAQKLFALVICADEADKPVKKNILAIDDMPDVLRTVKAMLREKYNVYGVTSGDEALKFMRSNTADMILLDIEMPEMDGFAMMQLFRTLPEYAKTPIIFLTSNVSAEYVKKALSLGAKDFIKKPVDLAVLIKKLDNAMSG